MKHQQSTLRSLAERKKPIESKLVENGEHVPSEQNTINNKEKPDLK